MTLTGADFMKLLYTLLFVSGLLSSCGEAEIDNGISPFPEGVVPIGFASSVALPVQTRGALTEISEMYIYASYTGTADWKSASHAFNYMYSQYANKPIGGTWTYSPLRYWPGNAEDKISFFAYAPVGAEDSLAVSAINATNPTFTYKVLRKESEQLDLLVASKLNCTNAIGKVEFSMQHALAQVVVKVKNGDASVSGVTLSGLTLEMPCKGTLTFNDTGNTADKVFSWSSPGETGAIVADVVLGGSSSKTLGLRTSATAAQTAATFFVLPMAAPAISVKFRLAYKLTKDSGSNNDESQLMHVAIMPPSVPAWTAGKVFTYTISVMDDRLELSSVTVTDFDVNGIPAGGNVPAT